MIRRWEIGWQANTRTGIAGGKEFGLQHLDPIGGGVAPKHLFTVRAGLVQKSNCTGTVFLFWERLEFDVGVGVLCGGGVSSFCGDVAILDVRQ